MTVTVNGGYIPKRHQLADLCNGDVVFSVRYELDSYILFRIILGCRKLRTTGTTYTTPMHPAPITRCRAI
jgi:hypothetical protein